MKCSRDLRSGFKNMAILELMGIFKSRHSPKPRISVTDVGIVIAALGCVSLPSRNWILATALIALGVAVFIAGVAKQLHDALRRA